jgi:hypothetical protein
VKAISTFEVFVDDTPISVTVAPVEFHESGWYSAPCAHRTGRCTSMATRQQLSERKGLDLLLDSLAAALAEGDA